MPVATHSDDHNTVWRKMIHHPDVCDPTAKIGMLFSKQFRVPFPVFMDLIMMATIREKRWFPQFPQDPKRADSKGQGQADHSQRILASTPGSGMTRQVLKQNEIYCEPAGSGHWRMIEEARIWVTSACIPGPKQSNLTSPHVRHTPVEERHSLTLPTDWTWNVNKFENHTKILAS